jgi:hypothetical protein
MFTLLQNQEPDVLGSIPPSSGYTSEDGGNGGDVICGLRLEEPGVLSSSPTSQRVHFRGWRGWRRCDWWAPGGETWCTGLQSSHRYTSEDGEDGGDVTGGLQVEEPGVLQGSSPPPTDKPQRMEGMEAMLEGPGVPGSCIHLMWMERMEAM